MLRFIDLKSPGYSVRPASLARPDSGRSPAESGGRLPALLRSLFVVVLASFLALTAAPAAQAQEKEILISVGDTAQFSDGFYAASAHAIQFDIAGLGRLGVGDEFNLQLASGGFYTLTVNAIGQFINGGQSLQASTPDASLSLLLTYSADTLFGYLAEQSTKRQIYAREVSNGFAGWLYIPADLETGNNVFGDDYVIPPRHGTDSVSYPDGHEHSVLPFQSSGQSGSGDIAMDSAPVTQGGIATSNFRIEQSVEQNPVIAGNDISVTASFTNTSQESHNGLSVEFYFLLENSTLLSVPSGCSEQLSLSLQRVLYCELGDFAAGQTKALNYVVQTSTASIPNVFSTAIVGAVRDDTVINVVEDVRLDSDDDGISDFNERLLGTDPLDASSVNTDNTSIDVMALYSTDADALYSGGAETRINQLIAVANQIYADSGVQITLRPVHYERVDYDPSADMDTALDALMNKTDPVFSGVDELRSRYGADLVMLFRPLADTADRCGLAPVGGYKTDGYFAAERERQYAYSTIAIDCPVDLVVAHELGHNMGLTHSHVEDGTGGTFDFATGHGVQGEFVTVMAYPDAFNTATRLPLFSSPALDCKGFSCGVAAGAPYAADAVQTLNLVRHQIAEYYPATVPELPSATLTGTGGESINARIALAASTDGGFSFSNRVSPQQALDVVADVAVDSKHVGLRGSVHVLVGVDTIGYLQLDAAGNLVNWDGSREGLTPATSAEVLRKQERLVILHDFYLPESLIGERVAVYVAYQLADSGEVVYTPQPLLLDVIPGLD